MKKVLITISVIVLVLVAGSFLRNPGEKPAPSNQQAQNLNEQTTLPTEQVADSKLRNPPVTEGVVNTIIAEATNEAQAASELEVDSSSFDAEIIEAGNIENAYDSNNF